MSLPIILILYFVLALAIVIRLLLYGMRPTKTLAWLLAIFTIPIGGMLFYFIMGRNRRRNKLYELNKTEGITRYLEKVDEYYHNIDHEATLPDPLRKQIKLVKLLTKSTKFLPSTGNFVKALKDGPETFDAIFSAMEQAAHFIHVQYYIFEDGDLANRFLSILKQKRTEGVQVRLMYDDLGSRLLSKKYIRALKEAGIEVHSFLPMRFGRLISSINYRNHRKIVVVDGKIAFTGGINVSDKYIKGDPKLGIWHDTHLQLQGPVVNSLQAVFAIDWSFASGNEQVLSSEYFLDRPQVGSSIAQTISNGPDSDYSSIHQLYLSMINNAREYVYIINPYIIPGEALIQALQMAALGGVDVRLMLPAKSDSLLVKWSVRAYFETFLEAGVKIYLFPNGFLHSKAIISDDELTTIGTANLDIRSFEQNYEVNVLIYEKEFAQRMKMDFLKDCKNCNELHYDEHLKRPQTERLIEGLAKVFSPIL